MRVTALVGRPEPMLAEAPGISSRISSSLPAAGFLLWSAAVAPYAP
ncbi:MAG: hypothetical protein ACOX2U_03100 [Limisphaerales bacterium]|nr:hypothetical protein [Verrucomicrobiota bacterium]